MKKKIILFASGSGTNVENIILYFSKENEVVISGIFCNKEGAGVIQRAEKYQIPVRIFDKKEFHSGELLAEINQIEPDLIVLAGFLWLMPTAFTAEYPQQIINIHPALLPLYGGKGMYGSHVHQAVIQNKEIESGITIHYVNEKFDAGKIIFQAKCGVNSADSAQTLAEKIHHLEYENFPEIISKVLNGQGE